MENCCQRQIGRPRKTSIRANSRLSYMVDAAAFPKHKKARCRHQQRESEHNPSSRVARPTRSKPSSAPFEDAPPATESRAMARPRSYSATSSNSTFSVNTLSSAPSEAPPPSAPHTRLHSNAVGNEQEMALGSLYDYLVKFILIGPSGCGKYASLVLLGRLGTDALGRVCCIGLFGTNGRR